MKKRGSGESKPPENLARRERSSDTPLRSTIRSILFALALWVAWTATYVLYTSPNNVTAVLGDPSPRDIKSPHQVTYISEVKTQEARFAAMSQVEDVYSGPEVAVADQQLLTLQNIGTYVTAIRHAEFADRTKKLDLIREIPALLLSQEMASTLLALSDDEWQSTSSEALRVLDLVMREEIRDSQIAEARRRVPMLTARTLTDEQSAVVAALAQNMVIPNSFFDVDQTLASREAARNAVEAVRWTIREGESILREGEIVSPLALEKLRVLGLLDSHTEWQEILGIALLCLIVVVVLSLYVVRTHSSLLFRPRRQFLLVLILIVAGAAAYVIVPGHTLLPYLFPTAAVAMIVAILLDIQLAMIVTVITAIVVGFGAGGSIELVIYSLAGGLVGALVLWRMDQLGDFVRATIYVALTNMTTILGFWLRSQSYDTLGLLQLMGTATVNAVLSSSLTFIAFSFIGRLFGITTSLQLLELARPTHPLFRQLLIKAPGTYHHSIVISNMAERAAEAVDADALLTRVGSYYHDIGKTNRPYFFAENQSDGENPHDKLDPHTSADIIISHTADGLALAHKYKLPDKVCSFIPEHHGTTLVTYFYRRATQESEGREVNEDDFRYPGPKPQSKESAIVMLADSIEAWVRANRPPTQAEMERVIRRVINDRLISGQLDECELTLLDLDKIREAFISVLQGIFHPRIQYPERAARQNHRAANGSLQ